MEWFILYALPLVILVGIIGMVLAFLFGAVQSLGRGELQLRLRRERAGDTFDMFRDFFRGAGVSELAVKSVYDELSNGIFLLKGFPVRPTDDLQEVFDIGPRGANDVDLLVRAIAAKLNVDYVARAHERNAPQTVEDLVLYVARMSVAAARLEADVLLRPSTAREDELLRPAGMADTPTTVLLHASEEPGRGGKPESL
jgi:hypothetical protein